MISGQQAFHQMTSYSQKNPNNVEFSANASSSDRSYSTEPPQSHPHHRLVPQAHRTYTNISNSNQNAYSHQSSHSMQPNTPRYPESSQRTHDEEQPNRNFSYEYPSHVDDLGGGAHPHSGHDRVHSMQKYPSSSETSTYPSNHDTLPPLNVESFPIDHHPQSGSPLGRYRATLRGYHAMQSTSLQNVSRGDHGQDHLQNRSYQYSQSHTMSYRPPRRLSDAADVPQHSHFESQTEDARESDAAHRFAPHHNMHTTSSIPMSNTPIRYPHHSNHPHHGFEQNQDLRHEQHEHAHSHHHQSRHVNVVTGSTISQQSGFHSSSSGRRNTSELNLRAITLPIYSQHSHPRSRSTPDPHTNHHTSSSSSYRISSYPRHTRSPLPISDNDSAFGSDAAARDEADFDRDIDPPPRFNVPGQEDGQMLTRIKSTGPSDNAAVRSPNPATEDSTRAGKKKKKSKMHECEICQKKFPRPSGLKTHMNTHSNAKPYPCGFPGCTRTFGVRSNAKRHLRTHGVIPAPYQPPGPSEVPYVVGFDTPTILPPQNKGRETQNPDLYRVGVVGRGVDEQGRPIGGQHDSREDYAPPSRVPTFKVRWMPLSLDTRANSLELREAVDDPSHAHGNTRKGKERWYGGEVGEYDEDNESLRLRMEMDDEREEDEEDARDDMYGDRAAASRLSLPLRLNMPSSQSSSSFAASVSSGSASASGSNMMIPSPVDRDAASRFSLPLRSAEPNSHSSLSFSASRSSECRCSPPCAADSLGMVNCRALRSIYFASISPSSTHSFATPSPSTSTSPINLPGGYSSVGPSSSHNNSQTSAHYNKRNSYLQPSSHPYHSSQR